MISACTTTNAPFGNGNAHVVTGANSLCLLLNFTFDGANKSFRIDVEVLQRTMHMARWESEVSRLAQTSDDDGSCISGRLQRLTGEIEIPYPGEVYSEAQCTC